MAPGDLIRLSSSFGVVFVSSVVILRIVPMKRLAFFVLVDYASTGSPGHGPIRLLIQSAEELGFFLGL